VSQHQPSQVPAPTGLLLEGLESRAPLSTSRESGQRSEEPALRRVWGHWLPAPCDPSCPQLLLSAHHVQFLWEKHLHGCLENLLWHTARLSQLSQSLYPAPLESFDPEWGHMDREKFAYIRVKLGQVLRDIRALHKFQIGIFVCVHCKRCQFSGLEPNGTWVETEECHHSSVFTCSLCQWTHWIDWGKGEGINFASIKLTYKFIIKIKLSAYWLVDRGSAAEPHLCTQALYFKTKVPWQLSSCLHPSLRKTTYQGKQNFNLAMWTEH
jgi:hypothetical protein